MLNVCFSLKVNLIKLALVHSLKSFNYFLNGGFNHPRFKSNS